MLWILLAIFTTIWTHIEPKKQNFVKELPLSPTGNHVTNRLTYSSSELKQIGDLMVRKVPNYYAIRRIKELKINRRRIRLQKRKKTDQRGVSLGNLSCLPRSENMPILNSKFVSFATVNARSLKQSLNMILEVIVRENLDFIVITETWLTTKDDFWLKSQMLHSLNLKSYSIPRPSAKRGGGLMLIAKSSIKVESIQTQPIPNCEHHLWKLGIGKLTLNILGLYHPPEQSSSIFIDNFLDMLESLLLETDSLIISGDFNLHVNDIFNADAIFFLEAITALVLNQHVKSPTHNKGNILDLIITEDATRVNVTRCVPLDFISDHRLVAGELNIKKEHPVKNDVTVNKLIGNASDVIKSEWNDTGVLNADCLETAIDAFSCEATRVKGLIYKSKTSKLAVRKKVPWYNEEVFQQRKIVRSRERAWVKYGEDHHWLAYKRERNRYKNLISYLKQNVITSKIVKSKGNIKDLYSIVNNITEHTGGNPMPPKDDQTLADEFADFFLEKIKKIRDLFTGIDPLDPPLQDSPIMAKFSLLTESQVKSVIMSMKTKSCELDPMPTHLLKSEIDIFLPSLTRLVNLSLGNGVFSKSWKCAIVRPLLKKTGLELIYKNYRPVSNLEFISKLTERCALLQFIEHCNNYSLLPDHQSAYRKDAGCETAVVKLTNDILWSMERGHCHASLFLDLSAAFDTVDHDILLDVLKNTYNMGGSTIDWYESYLRPRWFKVCVNSTMSSPKSLTFSVLQGSASGANLFVAYCQSLVDNIPAGISLQGFADDHFAHRSFNPNRPQELAEICTSFQTTMLNTKHWMDSMRLKLNPDKTEFVIFGSPAQMKKINCDKITLLSDDIPRLNLVKCLGTLMDSNLNFKQHVTQKCRLAMFNLRHIRSIRNNLTRDSCEILVNGLILSHLDYNNSVLVGLPDVTIRHMQRIQNLAAKLILKRRKYDSATSALKELHWLPIRLRIEFKICCIMHKCTYGQAPLYLKNLLTEAVPNLRLRSGRYTGVKYLVPYVKKKTHAERSFSIMGPRLWNLLPDSLRLSEGYDTFKRNLKTLYFNRF